MSNLRYYHVRDGDFKGNISSNGGATVALDKKLFIDADAKIGDKLNLNIGIAFCHSDDNYNKKLGREVATGRMVQTEFTVNFICKLAKDGEIFVELSSDKSFVCVKINGDKLQVVDVCRR